MKLINLMILVFSLSVVGCASNRVVEVTKKCEHNRSFEVCRTVTTDLGAKADLMTGLEIDR